MIFDKQYRDIRRTRKIMKIIDLPTAGNVIDISCGGGRLLKSIENKNTTLKLFGIDITPGFLALHPELSQIKFFTAEASQIPFPNNTFDLTICSLSIHHYKNLTAVLEEIKRVTKTNGHIYLIDIIPNKSWSQKIYNFIKCHEPYHFEKFYSITELTKLIFTSKLTIIDKYTISYLPRIQAFKLTVKST